MEPLEVLVEMERLAQIHQCPAQRPLRLLLAQVVALVEVEIQVLLVATVVLAAVVHIWDRQGGLVIPQQLHHHKVTTVGLAQQYQVHIWAVVAEAQLQGVEMETHQH